jgi:hypothetical protein
VISVGDTPADAKPILASDDPRVIRAMDALHDRIGLIDRPTERHPRRPRREARDDG